MNLKTLLYSICASAAMVLFSMPVGAAVKKDCEAGKPTAASYSWDFHSEANKIFADLDSDAQQVLDHAERLQSYSGLTWQAHADQLEPLRNEVNDMGAMLCRLETIRGAVSPWQQKTIDEIAAILHLMADNTGDAIRFGSTHPDELWVPTYQGNVNNLYNEAQSLTRNVGEAVQYSHVTNEYQNLRHELNVRSTS